MPTDAMAAEYRRRAAELRRLASQIEHSPVMTLHHGAGTETWTSPGADACRTMLSDDQARLRHAVSELYEQASSYERRAAELDAAAAAAAAAGVSGPGRL